MQALKITDKFWCPQKDFKIELYGSTSAPKASYMYLYVDYCDQRTLNKTYPN